MRLLVACALATLLGSAATYAASTASSATQPASATSASSTKATTHTPKTLEACEKEAVAKKLYGTAHDDFVKECQTGKKK
jgi:hypothetical protein